MTERADTQINSQNHSRGDLDLQSSRYSISRVGNAFGVSDEKNPNNQMGFCGSCSVRVKSWIDTFNDVVDAEVRKDMPDASEKEIQKEKIIRFNKIYQTDVRSIIIENSGKTKIDSPTEYVIKGKEVGIERDGHFRSLEEAFIKRMDKYDLDDGSAGTIRQACKEIQKSVDSVIYIPVHNIEKGQQKIRFVTKWERSGEKVKVTMLRMDGPDKSIVESFQWMKNNLEGFSPKVNKQDNAGDVYIFVKSDGNHETELTKSQNVQEHPRHVNLQRQYFLETPGEESEKRKQKSFVDTIGGNIKREFVHTQRNIQHYYEGESQRKREARLRNRGKVEQKAEMKHDKTERKNELEMQRGKKRLKESVLTHFIFEQKKVAEKKKQTIMWSAVTGVGIGGAILHLHELATLPVLKVTKKEKRNLRKEMRKMRMAENTQNKIVKKEKQIRKKEKKILKKEEKQSLLKKKEHVIYSQSKIEVRLNKKEKKKTNELKEKQKKFVLKPKEQRIVEIVNALKMVSLKKEKIFNRSEKKRKRIEKKTRTAEKPRLKKREQKLKKHEAVFNFFQAFLLFKLFALVKNEQSEKKESDIKVRKIDQKEQLENSMETETPFILLSIIWYLVMVREQGKVTYVKKKKAKKKGKNSIKKHGVIFDRTSESYNHAYATYML